MDEQVKADNEPLALYSRYFWNLMGGAALSLITAIFCVFGWIQDLRGQLVFIPNNGAPSDPHSQVPLVILGTFVMLLVAGGLAFLAFHHVTLIRRENRKRQNES